MKHSAGNRWLNEVLNIDKTEDKNNFLLIQLKVFQTVITNPLFCYKIGGRIIKLSPQKNLFILFSKHLKKKFKKGERWNVHGWTISIFCKGCYEKTLNFLFVIMLFVFSIFSRFNIVILIILHVDNKSLSLAGIF